MERWGTEEWLAPTHARFAADLLADCRTQLLRISTDLDYQREFEGRSDEAGQRAALTGWLAGERDKLIAAAAYAQWVSDHIRQEMARCQAEIRAVCARYAVSSDHLALLERETVPLDGIAPSNEPPVLPARLETPDDVDNLARQHRFELELAWRWASSALLATGESHTGLMLSLCEHIRTLCEWLAAAVRD